MAPIDSLLEPIPIWKKLMDKNLKDSDDMYYCYDLSAATDRLPLEIQKDILNIVKNGLGST
jgi:hypothetical protein